MSKEKLFLIVAALGLTPIALGYGLMPGRSLPFLYGVGVDGVSNVHILRAIMGLYLGMVVFWLMGARFPRYRDAALCSLVVFMLGLAAGRVLSFVIDGMPHPLLAVYAVLEIGFGAVGLVLLRRVGPRETARAVDSSGMGPEAEAATGEQPAQSAARSSSE
jgi:hypothetical protein